MDWQPTNQMKRESRIKPKLSKTWLHLLSGLMWCGVGLMLMSWTWIWSSAAGWREAWAFDALGAVIGIGTAIFFMKMAWRNHLRILALPERPCLFAFQSWWSYPLVIFMMGLGLWMKASPLPRTWLAGMYLAIGSGLFIAGLRYFGWLSDHAFEPGQV
jgi:hypothetical protein